jgi:hypothetical protein
VTATARQLAHRRRELIRRHGRDERNVAARRGDGGVQTAHVDGQAVDAQPIGLAPDQVGEGWIADHTQSETLGWFCGRFRPADELCEFVDQRPANQLFALT